jgi:hypothetical protein
MPMNQRFELFTLDFTVLRMLILSGCLRVAMRGETRIAQWNNFDKLLLSWVLASSLIFVVQQGARMSVIINRSGVIFDSVGMYWLFRQSIHTWEEVSQSIKIFAGFTILTAPIIALEKFQITNLFSLLGPANGQFHRGRFRAAGAFPHYIMMGCFWASLLPFFYAEIKANKSLVFYWLAIGAALLSIFCSASSTPIFTVVAIMLFWKLFNSRIHGKSIFWGTGAMLVILHLIMNAPVWHLIARIDIFGGSTGWHRYNLIDKFIKNASEWVLIGTADTAHWGWGLQDLTNQFVLEGVRGGALTLIIFILLIYRAVKIPGALSLAQLPPDAKWMSWGICVSMLGHFVTFWGVSYFGQMNMILYFTFALVGFAMEKSIEIAAAPFTQPQ